MDEIYQDIADERARQEQLRAEGRFEQTCAGEMPAPLKLAVLGEEFGEVARCVVEGEGLANDKHNRDLYKELIQTAAVCVAWCEAIKAGR